MKSFHVLLLLSLFLLLSFGCRRTPEVGQRFTVESGELVNGRKFVFVAYEIEALQNFSLTYGWDDHRFGGETIMSFLAGSYTLNILRSLGENGQVRKMDLMVAKGRHMNSGAQLAELPFKLDDLSAERKLVGKLEFERGETHDLLTVRSEASEFESTFSLKLH